VTSLGCKSSSSPSNSSAKTGSASGKIETNEQEIASRTAYDKVILAAISRSWLKQRNSWKRSSGGQTLEKGDVYIEFVLHDDGWVTDLRATKHTVSTELVNFCFRAIDNTAPFAACPAIMRRLLPVNKRSVYIHFVYD
jgi:hypothetical protein